MAMKRRIYLNGSIARKVECLLKDPRPLKVGSIGSKVSRVFNPEGVAGL
jgi:hypothetical protein